MKVVLLFFCNIVFLIPLKSMEQNFALIIASKIFNYTIVKCRNHSLQTINLDSIPSDILLNNMFPDSVSNDDCEFMTLINKYGIYIEQQKKEINKIINAHIMPLIHLSLVNKNLCTQQLMEEINRRKKWKNLSTISFNILHKYTYYNSFDRNFFVYLNNVLNSMSSIPCFTLNKARWYSALDFQQFFGITYKPKNLIKNFRLSIYLVRNKAQYFVFTKPNGYELLYNLCEKISIEYEKNDTIALWCEKLKKECLEKKTISQDNISKFLCFLESEECKNNKKNSMYYNNALEILKLGNASCPIGVVFAFKYIDGQDMGKHYRRIIKNINKNCQKDTIFDVNLFFDYIQKTFNDNSEETEKLISVFKVLSLQYCQSSLLSGMLYTFREEDYCVQFEINNNSAMSDQSILPLL